MTVVASETASVSLEASAGSRLIVDCFGCDHATCCDLDRGYEFLDKIPVRLGLVKQAQPYVFKTCESRYPGKPGYSGWVPLADGGAQIHTSSNNRFISIDLFVLRQVDTSPLEEMVREYFHPRQVEVRGIHRSADAGGGEADEVMVASVPG